MIYKQKSDPLTMLEKASELNGSIKKLLLPKELLNGIEPLSKSWCKIYWSVPSKKYKDYNSFYLICKGISTISGEYIEIFAPKGEPQLLEKTEDKQYPQLFWHNWKLPKKYYINEQIKKDSKKV